MEPLIENMSTVPRKRRGKCTQTGYLGLIDINNIIRTIIVVETSSNTNLNCSFDCLVNAVVGGNGWQRGIKIYGVRIFITCGGGKNRIAFFK